MIDAGKRRCRIVIQRFSGEVDVYGDPQYRDDAQWTDVCALWASVSPVSGKIFYAAQQAQAEVSHSVCVRYRAGLTTSMRVKYGDRIFRIVSILDPEERHEELRLMCWELVD